jgi:hypothetical protein
VTRWKPALNAFAVTFADRMPAAENLKENPCQKHRSSDTPPRREIADDGQPSQVRR